MNPIAVAIMGPTGVGKTSLSLELARNDGEIISADSMQVYKYLDVGTAKPDAKDRDKVVHRLIDIITPDKRFSAADFKNLAESFIFEISKKKKIPFLVGGTGLYFKSLINGMVDIPPIRPEVRESVLQLFQENGQEYIFDILKNVDAQYSERIHKNDKQRTIRALEVYYGTGKKYSDYLSLSNNKNSINYVIIVLNIERKILYDRINQRVLNMIDNGLVEEVKKVLSLGYKKTDPGMKGIGYKEIIEYLEGSRSLDDAISEICKNSRRYAKRQLTWFRSVSEALWVDNLDQSKAVRQIKELLSGYFREK